MTNNLAKFLFKPALSPLCSKSLCIYSFGLCLY